MTAVKPRSIEDCEERLDEIRAEVQNLNETYAGRKFPDSERARWNDLNAERDELDDTLAELRKRRARLMEFAGNPNATERAATEIRDGQAVPVDGHPLTRNGLPGLYPTDDQVRQLHRAAVGGQSLKLESRAVVTTALSGADDLGVQLGTRQRRERRIAAAAGLNVENVAGMTTVHFPVFGDGDAGITAENQAKTEYDSITPGSATPQMITIWTDTTRQNVLTMTNFESKLRSVLAAKVARREDLLLATTALGTSGIQTLDGEPDPDTLLEAAAMVAAGDVAAEPNLALVNPEDIAAVLGAQVGTGGSASPGFGAFLPTIHGMRVYPTTAVPAGESLVGAWQAAAHLVVGLGPTFLVDAISQIKTNRITILLEEAVALAVDEPAGFVHIRVP